MRNFLDILEASLVPFRAGRGFDRNLLKKAWFTRFLEENPRLMGL